MKSAFKDVKASTKASKAVIVERKDLVGLVDEVAEDCVASPMNGQVRSGPGIQESPRSVTSVRLGKGK
jgi:hypothetical protein